MTEVLRYTSGEEVCSASPNHSTGADLVRQHSAFASHELGYAPAGECRE
jgi:hypothetical protein